MQQDWNIKTRSPACDATGTPFAEGESFHTALYREGDAFRRTDLCTEAWESLSSDPSAPVPFSSWRSKFEPPAPPPPEPLPRDDAEGMLRRLLESEDPSHANTRYLLAVMLERKRVLRPQPSPDKDTLIYERAGTGETFIIADPHLSLSDLVSVQEEVSALLAGLSAPPPETAETDGETPADSHPEGEPAGDPPPPATAE
jgi:hypothetical protein